jgi:hypothetical protein
MINDAVILSEAKNLGSVSADARLGIDQKCFASLNMTTPQWTLLITVD